MAKDVLWFLLIFVCEYLVLGSTKFNAYNYEVVESPTLETLTKIRSLMQNSTVVGGEPIQAYIIPMNDAHQSEYISNRDGRIFYVTKFRGSAGTVIITEKQALLWTDSRYHIQAEQQLDLNYWTLMKQGKKDVPTTDSWLLHNLPNNSKIGVDPFILSSTAFQRIADGVRPNGHKLVPIITNLIDAIWKDRPLPSTNEIYPVPVQFTGETTSQKIYKLLETMKEKGAESIIVTALDEIAWLLNLRGSDIIYNPVFFSYLIITDSEVTMFVGKGRITSNVLRHFEDEGIRVVYQNYDTILNGITVLLNRTEGHVLITDEASYAIFNAIPENRRIHTASVIARMKTVKNGVEAEGIRNAHIRDGLALVRYLHWLNSTIDNERVTEISGATKLEEFRSEEKNFKGLSFETISAVGSNAALAHYEPSEETNKLITRDEIYLVDSGAQYWDGTTDVTRTMHFGTPTAYEKQCFTRVLKGFIALVTSVFPSNTPLNYFDNVARRELWQAGLDYGHGTGHGVGAFLNVHEYPPLITSRATNGPGALENMFTSDEPGFYEEGSFGIRIEDVIQVIKKSDLSDAFNGNGALTFETVTYAPIQTKMIDTSLLTKDEVDYVNNYHIRLRNVVGYKLLEMNLPETFEWLVRETRTIESTR